MGAQSDESVLFLRALADDLRALEQGHLDAGVEPVLARLWQNLDVRLHDIFDGQGLQLHMFRQPSFGKALANAAGSKSSPEALPKVYRYLIQQLRDDIETAIRTLEKK